jgi:hypothetical protein
MGMPNVKVPNKKVQTALIGDITVSLNWPVQMSIMFSNFNFETWCISNTLYII